MKKSLVLIAILLSAFSLRSENIGTLANDFNNGLNNESNVVLRLNFLFPSIELEMRAFNSNTIVLNYHPGYVWTKTNDEPTEFTMISQINGSFRYYYNIEKRRIQGKTLKKFSGNYISLYTNYVFENNITYAYEVVGPTWGIQRNYGKAFHFGLEFGAGLVLSNHKVTTPATLIADIKLGFSIDFKRNRTNGNKESEYL